MPAVTVRNVALTGVRELISLEVIREGGRVGVKRYTSSTGQVERRDKDTNIRDLKACVKHFIPTYLLETL